MAGNDAIAKTRSETLNLALDRRAHVGSATVGNVAVGPEGMKTRGRTGGIEQTGLDQKHIGFVVDAAVIGGAFGVSNFRQGATDVHGTGASAFGGTPRHRRTQSEIYLKNTGTIAIRLQPISVGSGQALCRDFQKLARGEVTKDGARRRKLSERFDARGRNNFTAQGAEMRGKSVGQLLRASGDDGPTDGVGADHQPHGETGGSKTGQRKHAVRGGSGKQGASTFGKELALGETGGAANGADAKGGEQERMMKANGAQDRVHQTIASADEGLEKFFVRVGIRPESFGGGFDAAFGDDRSAVVERMGKGRLRMSKLDAVAGERQGLQKRRDECEGVDSGADVVDKAGLGERGGTHATADGRLRFVNAHGPASLRENDGGSEAVGARADDDGVQRGAVEHVVSVQEAGVRGNSEDEETKEREQRLANRCRVIPAIFDYYARGGTREAQTQKRYIETGRNQIEELANFTINAFR